MLDSLEGDDRFTKLYPLFGINNCLIKGCLTKADTQRGNTGAGEIQGSHHRNKAGSPSAHQPVFGNPAVFHDQFTGGRGTNSHLVFFFAIGKAGIAFFHHKNRRTARTLFRIRHGDNGVNFSLTTIGDPLLGAVQHPFITLKHRSGLNTRGIRTGIGLSQTKCRPALALGNDRQIFCLHLVTTRYNDRVNSQGTCSKAGGNTNTATGKFFQGKDNFKAAAA